MSKRILFFIVIAIAVVLGIVFTVREDGGKESYVATEPSQFGIETPNATIKDSRYSDPSGFSFEIPKGYVARVSGDMTEKTFVFEKEGKSGSGFQMLVTPYDEPASEFTVARIRRDLPDLVMKEVKEFEIPNGRGVMFDSDSGREIWFAAADGLYQITSPQTDAEAAEHVAATFKLD